jgi:hypothetical protein
VPRLLSAQPRPEAEVRAAIVARAREQLGVSESSHPVRIAYFTKGRGGEWCTEFCSYVLTAARAVPEGFGYKHHWSEVYDWAQRTGRITFDPKPGDIVLWRGHSAIVEQVNKPMFLTIGGNEDSAVRQSIHQLGEKDFLAFVRTV